MDICVLLVTFNRKADLKKTLSLYENQTHKPRAIIVVDNNSTDGTKEMLESWAASCGDIIHTVISMPENVGGSGGFYSGLKHAQFLDHEWIFVSDDDAFPKANTLKTISDFADAHPELVGECAALCCAVDAGGHFALGHRARINKKSIIGMLDKPVSAVEYENEFFEVDFFSYIGTCIRKSALISAGLPRREFFIYSDDFEHSLRVGKQGKMLCIPGAVLYHSDNNPYSREATWRDYYATRNVLIMYREHFGAFAAFRRACMRRFTALRSMNPQKIKITNTAIKDAKRGVTGPHPIYRPGWKPQK